MRSVSKTFQTFAPNKYRENIKKDRRKKLEKKLEKLITGKGNRILGF